jgi:hypothetical protein
MRAGSLLPQWRRDLDAVLPRRDPNLSAELGGHEPDDLDDLVCPPRATGTDADGIAGERARDRLHGDRALILGNRGDHQSGEVISTCTSRPARTARIR